MTKVKQEIINEIKIWKDKNYLITNSDEHAYKRATVYNHFKTTFPSTELSKSTFGRYFSKLIANTSHTKTHYAGVQILDKPETPLPDFEEVEKITVSMCMPTVEKWFNDNYVWTTTITHIIEKKEIYERFKRENTGEAIPDFMVGLCLRRNSKVVPSAKYWKGILNKSNICLCCGQIVVDAVVDATV